MDITVVSAVGEGATALSAFDNALKKTGVFNYNLLILSSVIPPNVTIHRNTTYIAPDSEYGHKLYVVKADIRSDHAGKCIGAGLGWYQFGEDNRGIFVEHEATGDREQIVRSTLKQAITKSVRDLLEFRGVPIEEEKIKMELCVSTVKASPACCLVLAVYESEGWINTK